MMKVKSKNINSPQYIPKSSNYKNTSPQEYKISNSPQNNIGKKKL